MKRYGNLWSEITDFSNLVAAAKQAQRGKRFNENVLQFNYNLEAQLFRLQTELQTQTYQPGAYHTFEILEPKPRMISAAPYRDRVIHHALCNIISPIFERTFISTSYANRVGCGSHRALKKFTHYSRSSRYILLCDIRKYFPSIDHAILKTLLRQKLKCPQTLWLLDTIIDNSNPQETARSSRYPQGVAHFPQDSLLSPLNHRQGLPIGNLTSQFFANIYLNGFDHFIKETLKTQKYLRYVDDFALFSDDLSFLAEARLALEAYLSTLRLKIHPIKSQLFETKQGGTFVGFRVLPDRIRIRSNSLRRAKRRTQKLQRDYASGAANLQQVLRSLQSWVAHLNRMQIHRHYSKSGGCDRSKAGLPISTTATPGAYKTSYLALLYL
jgi:retron-type reverse transcriptase